MITIYLASPYTVGDVAVNVRESLLVADELVKLGFAPYPPLYSHFWHFLSPKPYEVWTELDKEWVLRCDCLLRLPGDSSGADAEVKLATENNIPVFYSVDDLMATHNPGQETSLRKEKDPLSSSLIYSCSHCHGFSSVPDAEAIDSGTTFTCRQCGEKTVVVLLTVPEYRMLFRRGASSDGQEDKP